MSPLHKAWLLSLSVDDEGAYPQDFSGLDSGSDYEQQHQQGGSGSGSGRREVQGRRGPVSSENLRGVETAAVQTPLKRATRLEEKENEVELSIWTMDSVAPVESVPIRFDRHQHQHQQLDNDHQIQAVVPTDNFANGSAEQQVTPEQSGHSSLPSALGAHLAGNALPLYENNGRHPPAAGFLGSSPVQSAYNQGAYVADLLAELERERWKNAQLQSRVTTLEARLDTNDGNGAFVEDINKNTSEQQQLDRLSEEEKDSDFGKDSDGEVELPLVEPEEGALVHEAHPVESPKLSDRANSGVTWMNREEVTAADLEKLTQDMVSEREDSEDSDEDEEEEEDFEEEDDGDERPKKTKKVDGSQVWKGTRGGIVDGRKQKPLLTGISAEGDQEGDESEMERKKNRNRKEIKDGKKSKKREKAFFKKGNYGHDQIPFRGFGNGSSYEKAPKIAFCPMEVKRIMESGVLGLKNAQSHTMQKIIVFASLCIRHGCEDLFELDVSHFKVVGRGEPHESTKNPGEHVLYDHPGVRSKKFFPNRENPIFCPVRILDEEMAMRPVGSNCPTCLFLCIKYGGRTRNLPQNEYVRQRMGRNKLKSFGPLMCQMALLVHIRTGSFFFKALGITLLFMAGFPDDLVRKETKYRNLDLLQKYYRSDEAAKGEQLFHPYPTFFSPVMMNTPLHVSKTTTVPKASGRKGPPPLLSKPPSNPIINRYLQPISAGVPSPSPFRGLAPVFSPPLASVPTVLPTSGSTTGTLYSTGSSPPPPLPPFGVDPSSYPSIGSPLGGFAPVLWTAVNSYPPGTYARVPFGHQPIAHASQFSSSFYGPPLRFPVYGQQDHQAEPLTKEGEEESGESDSNAGSRSDGSPKKLSEKGST